MRVTTSNSFDGGLATLQQRLQRLQDAQQKLTSGKRVEQASDDPTGAARAERALAAIGRVDANQRALEASRNSLTLGESALGDAGELLQQVREALVAAGNASYSDPERLGLADKIKGIRNQLLSIANRPDGSGGYLFSAQGSSSPPFLDQAGGVRFSGVSGNIQSGNIDNYQLTVDGGVAWEQARSGNGSFVTEPLPNALTGAAPGGYIDAGSVTSPAALTGHNYRIDIAGNAPAQTYTITDTTAGSVAASGAFTPGQTLLVDGLAVAIGGQPVAGDAFSIAPATNTLKVFDVIDRAITELSTTLRTGAQITQSNTGRLRDVDAVLGNLQSTRSNVGAQLNNLDGSETRLSALKLYNQQEESAATDLDVVKGISDFKAQQSGYDAALQVYASVQRLSLLQYLK